MKKLFSIACTAMLLAITPFISCQKSEVISKEEQSLQLEAPSGQRIAASVSDIRKEAATIIAEKFGSGTEFRLTAIDYLPVSKGYAAIISYQLTDGAAGNYATVESASFAVESASIITSSKKAKKVGGALVLTDEFSSKVSLVCNKTGTCDCRIEGTINVQTGVITWKCSCDQCQMQIIIS